MDMRSAWRPEAASESPSGVKTRRKKRRTKPKNVAETMSRSFHCRALRFEAGKFRCPMPQVKDPIHLIAHSINSSIVRAQRRWPEWFICFEEMMMN